MNWIARVVWMWTIAFSCISPHIPLLHVHARAMPLSRDFLLQNSEPATPQASQQQQQQPHRRSFKRLKHARINALKQDFLAKMGYTHVPDVANVNTTSEEKRRAMRLYREVYEQSQGKEHVLFDEEEFMAKQLHQFTSHDCSPKDECFVKEQDGGLLVRFATSLPEPEDYQKETKVHSASLKLYKHSTHPHNLRDTFNIDRTVRISIYQVVEFLTSNRTLRSLVDSKMVSVDSIGWETFDVTSVVTQWKNSPDTNLGLLIICDSQPLSEVIEFTANNLTLTRSNLAIINEDNSDRDTELIPTLDVYTQEQLILRRQKRAAERYNCRRGDGERRCCRYPLEVRFADIGWEWIIAPLSFQAYFCDGNCPRGYKMRNTFASIQSLMHAYNPAAAPAPCCSASRLGSLPLVHYNQDGQLIVTNYEDMIVQACKCS